MAKADDLIESYEDFVGLPWQTGISGAERVWFAIYDPSDERRIRCRLGEFENATKRTGHPWSLVDLTHIFERWMSEQENHQAYFESPDFLSPLMGDFAEYVSSELMNALECADHNTVVGVVGCGTLFGFIRVSQILDRVSDHVRGRLLVLFPGSHSGSAFRLLDARDGWNYRAVPITA